MRIVVKLFARAKDLAGSDAVQLELPSGARVADVRRALATQVPALAALLERSALAVDNDFAAEDRAIAENAEVALLPPVSGG